MLLIAVPAADQDRADEHEQGLDERDREPVQHGRAERDRLGRDGEQQPVHRRLADAEAGGREDREHGDDRPDRGDPTEVRDLGDGRVAAERAEHEEERRAAERPRQRVEAEQLERRPRRQRHDLAGAEGPQQLARDGREHGRVEQEGDQHGERGEREQRCVAAADDREPDDEDADAGERREPGLEHDRREHDRRVLDAEAAQRDDARGRRPDAAGDVLGEHREHLRLQRVAVRDPDPVGGEDAQPAEHEDEVVDGDDRGRDRDVAEVGVAQQRRRLRPDVPQRVGERAEQDAEADQLERDVDALVAEEFPESLHDHAWPLSHRTRHGTLNQCQTP